MSSSPCEECAGRVCGPRRGGGGGIHGVRSTGHQKPPDFPVAHARPQPLRPHTQRGGPSLLNSSACRDRDLQPGLYLWGWGGWGEEGPSQPWTLTGSSSPAPWVQCLRTERQKQKAAWVWGPPGPQQGGEGGQETGGWAPPSYSCNHPKTIDRVTNPKRSSRRRR